MIRSGNIRSRILCLVLCLAALLCLAVPALAAESSADASSLTYSSKVHNRAKLGSSVIGQLGNGTRITVLDETKYFYKIDCFELTGFIAKAQVAQKDDQYYVNCDTQSEETLVVDTVPMAEALNLRSSILKFGKQQLDKPYISGERGPNGFDCSGLTDYIFKNNGIQLSRAADTQIKDGIITSRENLQAGDLVFFRDYGSPWLATHVGIYVGNDQFLHASSSRGVRFDNLDSGYFGARYIGGRRVVNFSTEGIEQAPTAAVGLAPAARGISGIRTAD